MSDRLQIPAAVIALVLATGGAYTLLNRAEDAAALDFPDDGQTWIALRFFATSSHGEPKLDDYFNRVELTSPSGDFEVVQVLAWSFDPFVVTSSGPVQLCPYFGEDLMYPSEDAERSCGHIVLAHGTLYEFWSDTLEVFTTDTPTMYRVRDGECVDVWSC